MGDMTYILAFGLMAPVFALFLRQQIMDASLLGVGLAEASYLLALGLVRPFVELSCRNDTRGWRTRQFLWFGSVLAVLAPFFYIMARDMVDVYVIQFLFGVGIAFSEPAWTRVDAATCPVAMQSIWFRFDAFGSLLAAGLAVVGGMVAEAQGMPALLFYLGCTLFVAALMMAVAYGRVTPPPRIRRPSDAGQTV